MGLTGVKPRQTQELTSDSQIDTSHNRSGIIWTIRGDLSADSEVTRSLQQEASLALHNADRLGHL